MPDTGARMIENLFEVPPFDLVEPGARAGLLDAVRTIEVQAGEILFREGSALEGLYVVRSGALDIESSRAELVSQRGPGDFMGERGLLRDGTAQLTAKVTQAASLFLLPAPAFKKLIKTSPAVAAWFGAGTAAPSADTGYSTGLTAMQVSALMVEAPVICASATTVTEVARLMRDREISSVLVMDGKELRGIVTVHDLTSKVLAEGLSGQVPVSEIMTPNPITISPRALGLDALMTFSDLGINHLPVAEQGRIVGMVARSDLIRHQAVTASHMAADIAHAGSAGEMAGVMQRMPALLAHLVAAGTRHWAVTRRITDITDAITRRLLALAEEKLGPPPVPYLWAACGSQGRQEQSGVSDQDNCLILDDAFQPADDAYFAALAKYVCDGLATCGFFLCPGDMMATNLRWRQPRRVWRKYFADWIAEPDTEAQMLASVMFDLRAISGTETLYGSLQDEVLTKARSDTIFLAHMVTNARKHTPPLNLFRGFALIRSGEHKNTVDLKHSGVVPIVDLGRLYALKGHLTVANTRERLVAAGDAGIISKRGARDLIDAFDLIADTRLAHQARQVRMGQKPDNYLALGDISELERSHLRNAFMIIRTMQSSLGSWSGGMS